MFKLFRTRSEHIFHKSTTPSTLRLPLRAPNVQFQMSQDSIGGIGNNPDRHRPHDGENDGIKQIQKKPTLEGDHTETHASNAGVQVAQDNRIMVPDSQEPTTSTSDPNGSLFRALRKTAGQGKWCHNRHLGFKATQDKANKQRDRDGDTEMQEDLTESTSDDNDDDSNDSQEVKGDRWMVVAHHRERILAVKVAHRNLKGKSVKAKLEDLMDLLIHLRINPVSAPTTMRVDGVPYFRVTVANQDDMDDLLDGIVDDTLHKDKDDEDGNTNDDESKDMEAEAIPATPIPLFERIDATAERQHDIERSIELYGLPARINMELLKFAGNQFGTVERVTLRGCSRGVKMIATITYEDADDVLAMKEMKIRNVRVGNNVVRIRRMGDKKIQWDLDHVRKLHGLPRNTHPFELMSTLEKLQVKVDFVEIPKYYVNNGTQLCYRKEAFVYFRSEQDANSAMATNIQIGYSQLQWLDPKEKRCYTCNQPMHDGGKCPTLQQQIKERTHQKKVMEFHAAARSHVREGTSFADLLNGKGKNIMERKQAKKAQQGATTKPDQEQQKELTLPRQAPSKTEENYPSLPIAKSNTPTRTQQSQPTCDNSFDNALGELMERQKTLEASVAEMKNMVTKFMTVQNNVMMSMQSMFEEMKGMFSRAFHGNAPPPAAEHQILQAPISSYSSQESEALENSVRKSRRLNLQQQAGKSRLIDAPIPNIPSATASRAGIERIITDQQNKNTNENNRGNSGRDNPTNSH
ncbi:hypothetical protein BGZ79_000775 [Entomortierella chlamydospora]|nr:hypothetical protein BGZ79_000775 [Entomortierella chlamydospora]